MNKDLKFLLKRAFDAGTMYEATLSEECSFNEFIKYVKNQQLSICDVVSSNVKNNNKTTKIFPELTPPNIENSTVNNNGNILIMPELLSDISSTEIRSLLTEPNAIKNKLPDKVHQYILQHKLYRIEHNS